jgi:hypothetical protein
MTPVIDQVDSSDVTFTDNTRCQQAASHHFIQGPDAPISVYQSDIQSNTNESHALNLGLQLQSELTKRPDYQDSTSNILLQRKSGGAMKT